MPEDYPRLGCAAVVRKDDKILMGTRGKDPHYGKWILPGGGVEYLEHHHDTLRREIREETGMDVEVGELIGVYNLIEEPDEHRVIIYHWADTDDEPDSSDDLREARFLGRSEVYSLLDEGEVTPLVSRVLEDIGWAP